MERGVLDSFQVLLRQTGPQRCHADEDEQQGRKGGKEGRKTLN